MTAELQAIGLVRVTVATQTRRIDLALPSALSVAELLPELARSLGALDSQTAHAGFRLVTSDGHTLSTGTGLGMQNVHDGAVLSLVPDAVDDDARVYDDVVEAMADVVEAETVAWDAAAGRRAGLVAAGALLAVGAAALTVQRTSVVAGALAGALAVVLVVAAVVVDRVQREHDAALLLAWGGVVMAAVSGVTVVDGGSDGALGLPLVLAGGGAAVAGAASWAGLVRHRALLVPAVVLGVVVAAASALVIATDWQSAAVYTVALGLVVAAASLLPSAALVAAGRRAQAPEDPLLLDVSPDAEPDVVDADSVAQDADTGHDLLLAVIVTVGLLGVGVAPLAVHLGVCGALVAAAAGVVQLLRTRQHRDGREVAAGLAAGAATLLATAVSAVVLHADWRPALAVGLSVLAAGTLLATLVPTEPSVRRGRLAEVAEAATLVAMIPLLVVAVGVVSAVRS